MEILEGLVKQMSKDEVRFFKLFSSRSGDYGSRKDQEYFDFLRNSEEINEPQILKALYPGGEKNSFYRLRHRLLETVSKSLLLQHLESDNTLLLHHLISRVRFFFMKRNFQEALHFLKKAESIAIKNENLEILDIIYGEYIKLSHEKVDLNPEAFIQKRKENNQKLQSLRQIEDVLAAASYRVKVSQNFGGDENPILELLEKTTYDFTQDKKTLNSPKLQLSLYSAVSQVLLQKRDYKTLEKYLLTTYRKFSKSRLFNRENHGQKLQMLTYIVNALFKNGKVEKSLAYTRQLHDSMQEFGKMLYGQYLFFYYNSLVINYSIADKAKAIELLEELKGNEELKKTPFYEIFVHLNLAVLWFDKKEFHRSIKELNKLYLHATYKNADISLRFKISIAELIIRYEIGDFDFLENRIVRIEKDFLAQLNTADREIRFLGILRQLPYAQNMRTQTNLTKEILEFIQSGGSTESVDSEIIQYNEWLEKFIKNDYNV